MEEQESPSISQHVMLLPDSVFASNKATVCKLKHPKTLEGAMFIFGAGKDLYELMAFNNDTSSWFIETRVQSDGKMFIASPVDPMYLALPYIMANTDKYCLLDQIIVDGEFPDACRLCSSLSVDVLDHITDSKGQDDIKAYRYNEQKTLQWLVRKVERLRTIFKEENVNTNVSGASMATNFMPSGPQKDENSDDSLRFAWGFLSDYLCEDVSEKLKDLLGIVDVVHEKPEVAEPNAKKSKTDSGPTDDYTLGSPGPNKAKTKLTKAQKSLSKVDTKGMKSMSSFFKAKSAPK